MFLTAQDCILEGGNDQGGCFTRAAAIGPANLGACRFGVDGCVNATLPECVNCGGVSTDR